MSVPIGAGNMDLKVTASTNKGDRQYQEDTCSIAYYPPLPEKATECCTLVDYGSSNNEQRLLFSYFGVFDGHGGPEAATYAEKHLMREIIVLSDFWSDDDGKIKNAIRTGFKNTQREMHKAVKDWPTYGKLGLQSPSGTTASIAFIRQGKLFIGHLGDSGIVLGYKNNTVQSEGKGNWIAKTLTTDHKPSDQVEKDRIIECGGKVAISNVVTRVVWTRESMDKNSTGNVDIPYLSVSRSLGDFWSYNPTKDTYVVSPDPDVSVIEIDVNVHRCIIIGSDGLWNVLSPQDAVESVYVNDTMNRDCVDKELQTTLNQGCGHGVGWTNPSNTLVKLALEGYTKRPCRADNVTVVTILIKPSSASQ